MGIRKKIFVFTIIVSIQCTCLSFLVSKTSTYRSNIHNNIYRTTIRVPSCQKTTLFNSNTNQPSSSSPSKERSKGVYSRPSAAIEKGSGFFVPGLEGSKVRILFGALVLLLNAINHQVSVNAKLDEVTGFALSEKIATFYGIFLLFQGLIEFAKEIGLGFDGVEDVTANSVSSDNDSALSANVGENKGVEQYISPTLTSMGEDALEAASWVAATYLSLTPATHVMLLGKSMGKTSESNILYRLGNFGSLSIDPDEDSKSSIDAAIDTVYQSKGGRVSIPTDHPGAMLLPEDSRRCVLLQQVDIGRSQQVCILVGSDQLLATYTKNDLKWLGILGLYLTEKI